MNPWEFHCQQLERHFEQDDISTFFDWPVLLETMIVGNSDFIAKELQVLQNSHLAPQLDYLLEETPTYPQHKRYANNSNTSPNTIHHLYQLCMLQIFTKINIGKINNIFEFGGGYGNMARLAYRLGFTGQYHIWDLPQLVQIQKYYLGQHGLLDQVRWNTLLPKYDLFIATWSLCEAPPQSRVIPFSDYYLIIFSKQFHEYDNMSCMNILQHQRPQTKWTMIQHPFIPTSCYLLGQPKNNV